ncbi:MAG: TPM domain-containing protein [Gallionellaceae bacterium]|nr:TPM domain-containing protein [Gallionellaceae bacterium]
MNRLLRHLLFPDWLTRRRFPVRVLKRIEAAVAASERGHSAELRFAVEGALHPRQLMAAMSGRERALEVFSNLRIWDTAANNGVLIYLLLADRDVEIVADRGLSGLVQPVEWEAICRDMETCFQRGEFEAGTLLGIERVDILLRRYFPASGENPNELPDAPSVL